MYQTDLPSWPDRETLSWETKVEFSPLVPNRPFYAREVAPGEFRFVRWADEPETDPKPCKIPAIWSVTVSQEQDIFDAP